jgi:hypothetical protein
LFIGRNAIYFTGKRPNLAEATAEYPADILITILYRDINGLEIVSTKRVLVPDAIQIETKERQVKM